MRSLSMMETFHLRPLMYDLVFHKRITQLRPTSIELRAIEDSFECWWFNFQRYQKPPRRLFAVANNRNVSDAERQINDARKVPIRGGQNDQFGILLMIQNTPREFIMRPRAPLSDPGIFFKAHAPPQTSPPRPVLSPENLRGCDVRASSQFSPTDNNGKRAWRSRRAQPSVHELPRQGSWRGIVSKPLPHRKQ